MLVGWIRVNHKPHSVERKKFRRATRVCMPAVNTSLRSLGGQNRLAKKETHPII
jgi:hypothetical protein